MGGWEGEKEAFAVGGSDTGNGRSTDCKTVPLLLPERRREEKKRSGDH